MSAVDRNRKEGYSAEHVLHELLITEFLLDLWRTTQKRDDLELLRVERRSLARNAAFRLRIRGRPEGNYPAISQMLAGSEFGYFDAEIWQRANIRSVGVTGSAESLF